MIIRLIALYLCITALLSYAESPSSNRLVFAHYFPPFPLSLDNRESVSDSYARDFLSPNGQGGKYVNFGGYLSDRPLPRLSRSQGDWRVEDLASEVRMAKSVGISGFVIDVMGHDLIFDAFFSNMLKAIELTGLDFKLMLMPDMEATWGRDKDRMVDFICKYGSVPQVMRFDGRVVVSPYNAETRPIKKDRNGSLIDSGWWRDVVKNRIPQACAMEIFFVPLFQGVEKYVDDYYEFSEGFSDWGPRDVVQLNDFFLIVARIKKRYPNKLFFFPIAPQDARPKSGVYWEADGIELLERSLKEAEKNESPWLHLITWNDYSENTHFSPSCRTGYGYIRYLSRKLVAHQEDEIFVFHRRRFDRVIPLIDNHWRRAVEAIEKEEHISVVAFLNEPGIIELTVGDHRASKSVAAGYTKINFPVNLGVPVVKLIRAGTVISSVESVCRIKRLAKYDDYQYCSASSVRQVSLNEMPACELWID